MVVTINYWLGALGFLNLNEITDARSTGLFGKPVAVASDPYGEERAAWDSADARLGGL
ncbi:MAG: hypothetical protein OXE40_16980 [Gammaproteobacteria bacterium]|nr:hypothetical protein [Gammaproteobacteria bacterium]